QKIRQVVQSILIHCPSSYFHCLVAHCVAKSSQSGPLDVCAKQAVTINRALAAEYTTCFTICSNPSTNIFVPSEISNTDVDCTQLPSPPLSSSPSSLKDFSLGLFAAKLPAGAISPCFRRYCTSLSP